MNTESRFTREQLDQMLSDAKRLAALHPILGRDVACHVAALCCEVENLYGGIHGDQWSVDQWREEYRQLLSVCEEHVAELNRRGTALQRIAMLADTMSPVHYTGPGQPVVNGWRVAEAMREVAIDVIGTEPTCDSCGGEGQVQLADEGGNRMWWSCPACNP